MSFTNTVDITKVTVDNLIASVIKNDPEPTQEKQ